MNAMLITSAFLWSDSEGALRKLGGHVIERDKLCRSESLFSVVVIRKLRNCKSRGQLQFQIGAATVPDLWFREDGERQFIHRSRRNLNMDSLLADASDGY